MSSESKPKWTRKLLLTAIDESLQQKKQKQITIRIDHGPAYDPLRDIIHFNVCHRTYTMKADTQSFKMIGEVILDLSKDGKYDRIIEVKVKDESPIILDFMKPLLVNEFTSLISLTKLGEIRGRSSDFVGIKFASTYNTLCEMISRDKMISVVLGFYIPYDDYDHLKEKSNIYDIENKQFLIDTGKLIDSIKSTNTLQEIIFPVPMYSRINLCEELQQILKEALSMNFSVTTITALYQGGSVVIDSNTRKVHGWRAEGVMQTANKYKLWWPAIKKRNEECQKYNRILVGDEKEDGIWNNWKCPYQIAQKVLKTHFALISSLFFNQKGDRCFCWKCHSKRKDKMIYKRGKPAMQYVLPVGWVRFGLKTDEGKCFQNKVWDEWHVAYHGTTKDVIPQIFESGLVLLKPGDYTMNGTQLQIRSGHIAKDFERFNKFTKKKELFNPNQIYVSPSIKYSAHSTYAKSFYCSHPEDNNRTVKIQFAFQLRIRPGSYKIGQETVGAAKNGKVLDEHFSNNELEWYTKQNVGIILHGLLLRVKEINVPSPKIKKETIVVDEKKSDE